LEQQRDSQGRHGGEAREFEVFDYLHRFCLFVSVGFLGPALRRVADGRALRWCNVCLHSSTERNSEKPYKESRGYEQTRVPACVTNGNTNTRPQRKTIFGRDRFTGSIPFFFVNFVVTNTEENEVNEEQHRGNLIFDSKVAGTDPLVSSEQSFLAAHVHGVCGGWRLWNFSGASMRCSRSCGINPAATFDSSLRAAITSRS
jgi:hypothetical protein